jgi:integrase
MAQKDGRSDRSGAGYPGVRFRRHPTRKHGVKYDRYFSIYYRLPGKKEKREEGLGWESEGWTAQKAAIELSKLKEAQKTGQGAQTLAEKRDAARTQREAEKKRQADEAREAVTFSEIFDKKYIPAAVAALTADRTAKSAKSIDNEKRLFKTHVKAIVGHLPLKAITSEHIQDVKRAMTQKGRAPRTIEYTLAVIRQIFNFAKDKGLFHGDRPGMRLKKRKTDNKRVRFLTVAEADILLKTLHEISPDVSDITLLSLHAGLRASEIFGLTWGDLDFQHTLILVKDTKSGDNRHVPMTEEVKKMLEGRLKGKPGELVFSGRVGAITSISRTFDRVVESLGLNQGVKDRRLRFVFHSCRHTYASWLVQSGVDLYAVAKLLGHKTIVMTERYSHLSPEVFTTATDALQKQIKEGRKRLRLVKEERKQRA